MAADLTLQIRLKADGSDLVGSIRLAKGELDSLGNAGAGVGRQASEGGSQAKRALDELGQSARSLKATLAGLGLGLGLAEASRAFIEANTSMQAIRATLTAVTGSARGAASELAYVRSEADRLGLNVSAAAKQLGQLQAASEGTRLAGAGARQVFADLASAARVLHLSEADLGGVITAATQMLGKQTVAAEELRGQMAERIPGAMTVAAKAMGVTTAQLSDMIEKGQVLAEDFLPRFAATLKDKFAAGLADATQGLHAQSQRLSTAIFEGLIKIGEGGALQALTEGIRGVTEALKSPEAETGAQAIGAAIKFAADHLHLLAAAAAAYAAVRLAPILLEAVSALALYGRTLTAVATGQAALLTGASGLAGVVSLIGGWPVVIAGAVAALVALTATETKADAISKGYAESIDKIVEAKKRLATASGEAKSALQAEIQGNLLLTRYALEGQIEKAAEEFNRLTRRVEGSGRFNVLSDRPALEEARTQLQSLRNELLHLRAVAGEFGTEESPELLRGLQAWATAAGASDAALDAAQQRMKELTERTQPATKAAAEFLQAQKDLQLLIPRIGVDEAARQLGILEQHYRSILAPLSEFLDKLRQDTEALSNSAADQKRLQVVQRLEEIAKAAGKTLGEQDYGDALRAVDGYLTKQGQLAQRSADATLQFERQKAALAGNAQALGAGAARLETYNYLLKNESEASAELFRTTGQLSEAGKRYLDTQLKINAAKTGSGSGEYLRGLNAEIAANERLAAATLEGAAAVAEAEKQNRIELEVLKQGEGARAAIAAAEERRAEALKKLSFAQSVSELTRQVDATRRLAAATSEGAAAVEEATIKNEVAEKLSQLRIASGTKEAAVVEELIRQLHGYASALDAANAIRGQRQDLDRLREEISLAGEVERVRVRELALFDARRVIAEQGAKWTEAERARYLDLAASIADARGELAAIERERELWEEPFKNALKGIQDAFSSTFKDIFRHGIKSFGNLADKALDIFSELAAQIATLLVFRPALGGVLTSVGAPASLINDLGVSSYSGGGTTGTGSGFNFNLGGGAFAQLDTYVNKLLPGVFSYGAGAATTAAQAASQYGISAGQAAQLANSGGLSSALPFTASQALSVIGAGLPHFLQGNFTGGAVSTVGAIASQFLPPPFNFIGTIASSFLGGLFGKKPTSGPNAGATIGVREGGLAIIGSGADNKGEVETAITLAEGAIKGLDRVLAQLGATVSAFRIGPDYADTLADDRGLEIGYHKQKYFVKAHDEEFSAANNSYEKPEDAVAAFIVRALKGADLSGVSAEIATALAHTSATDLEALLADLDFAKGFRRQIELMSAGLDPATAQLGQLNAAADKLGRDTLAAINDFVDKTVDLGLATKDEVLPALRGMVEGLLGLAPAEQPLSGVALALKTFELNARALQPALEAVGLTAKEATETINAAIANNARNVATGLLDTLHAQANPFLAAFQSAAGAHQQNYADLSNLFGRGALSGDELTQGAIDANTILGAAIDQAFEPIKGNVQALVEVFRSFADDGSAAGEYIRAAARAWIDAATAAPAVVDAVAQVNEEARRLLDQLSLRELRLAGDDRGALILQAEQSRDAELAAAAAAGLTAAELQRLAAVLDGEAAKALADFDAQLRATAEQAARASRDFDTDLTVRALRAGGQDRAALEAELRARGRAETEAAAAAGRTSEQIAALAHVLDLELIKALADFDAAAQGAAQTVDQLAADLARAFGGVRKTLADTFIGLAGSEPLANILGVIAPGQAEALLAPFADFLAAAKGSAGHLDSFKAAIQAVLDLQGSAGLAPETVDNLNGLLRQILTVGDQAARAREQAAEEARRLAEEQARAAAEAARQAEELVQRRVAIEQDLGVRLLQAQGKNAEARLAQFQLDAERQRAEFRAVGGNLALLNTVLGAELAALNQTLAQEAAEIAADAARFNQDLDVRLLRATGHELDARLAEFDAQAQAQRQEAARLGIDLDRLNQVLDLERRGVIDEWEGVADAARRAAEQAADAFKSAYEQLKGVAQNLGLSEVSPLSPQQRLTEAQSAFAAAVEGARARDTQALAGLGQVTEALLKEARSFYASGSQYGTLFQLTRSTVEQVLAELGPAYHSLLAGVPGFAEGGTPPLGRPVWVGERGPELVRFLAPARVFPHGEGGGAGDSPAEVRALRDEVAGLRAEMRALVQQNAALLRVAIASGDQTNERLTSIDQRQGEVVRLARQRNAGAG